MFIGHKSHNETVDGDDHSEDRACAALTGNLCGGDNGGDNAPDKPCKHVWLYFAAAYAFDVVNNCANGNDRRETREEPFIINIFKHTRTL